jgi:Histidine kinase-, DNA gyrase B-, and HSP90-like ATPase
LNHSEGRRGVPAAERERVFDPFHWLQPTRDQARGGAGLGLAIVRDAVTAHGGQVWFADQAAGPRSTSGSRFPAPTAVPTAATQRVSGVAGGAPCRGPPRLPNQPIIGAALRWPNRHLPG